MGMGEMSLCPAVFLSGAQEYTRRTFVDSVLLAQDLLLFNYVLSLSSGGPCLECRCHELQLDVDGGFQLSFVCRESSSTPRCVLACRYII